MQMCEFVDGMSHGVIVRAFAYVTTGNMRDRNAAQQGCQCGGEDLVAVAEQQQDVGREVQQSTCQTWQCIALWRRPRRRPHPFTRVRGRIDRR